MAPFLGHGIGMMRHPCRGHPICIACPTFPFDSPWQAERIKINMADAKETLHASACRTLPQLSCMPLPPPVCTSPCMLPSPLWLPVPSLCRGMLSCSGCPYMPAVQGAPICQLFRVPLCQVCEAIKHREGLIASLRALIADYVVILHGCGSAPLGAACIGAACIHGCGSAPLRSAAPHSCAMLFAPMPAGSTKMMLLQEAGSSTLLHPARARVPLACSYPS